MSNNSCISLGQGCTSPTNLPSYIDTASCLCGLLSSASKLPDNGEQIEMWRCIGNASDNVSSGTHGKWYNTSQPSQELSGINEPQNWGENPPDLSQVYVLDNGYYQKWSSGSSPDLTGADPGCTGKNDTGLSGMYYAKGNGTSNSTSASSTMTASSTGSGSSATAMSTSGATMSATGKTTATSTSSSSSPTASSSKSAATRFSLSSALLLGMIAAPFVSLCI